MNKEILDALKDIKKLVMLGLVSNGVQANSIARVLGVGKSSISGIVPTRKVKKAKAKP